MSTPRRRTAALTVGLAFLGVLGYGLASEGRAHSDPGAICGTADTPPCAPPAPFTLTPEQGCAIIAWRTLVPCNWWGYQVPEGTPGSVG